MTTVSRFLADTPKRVTPEGSDVLACTESDCDREAAVVVHVPWAEDRPVCAAHGRALVQQDGVVATTLEEADAWE